MMNELMIFIIQTIIQIVVLLFLLRFMFNALRVDYYNPITQGVLQITDPVVRLFSFLAPRIFNLDLPSLLAAFAFCILEKVILFGPLNIVVLLAMSSIVLLELMLEIIYIALFLYVLISWISPGSNNPGASLVNQLIEPIVSPVRRWVPPVGGLDFSVIIVFFMLMIVKNFLVKFLWMQLG